jgi:ComF family protein
MKVWNLFEPAVEYLFPALCVHCKLEKRCDSFLCEGCRTEMLTDCKRGYRPHDMVFCLYRLTPVVRSLIHALKYQGMTSVAMYLVQNYPGDLEEWGRTLTWIPVPVHPGRLRERGYNQSECIARGLQAKVGGTVLNGILKRSRYAESQTKLAAQERRWNIAGSFTARPPVPPSVIIVDDVYTTGSTTAACENALLRAGARSVRVVTLAYEPKGGAKDDWELDQAYWRGNVIL